MTIINLTAGNDSLAKIRAIRSARKWANLTTAMLAPADQANLRTVSAAAFNEELTDSTNVISIQFDDDKNYKRSYAPSLYRSATSDDLVVKFGNDIFTFKDITELDLTVEEIKLERYEDPCLVITYEVEEDEYVKFPLPLRLNKESFKDFDLTKAQGWVKKGQLNKLAAVLMEAKTGGGSSSDTPMVSLTDLPENGNIKVVKARAVNASYGKSYILTALNADGQEVQLWAPYSVKEYLNLGAEIGADTYMIYQNYVNNSGDTRQAVVIENLVWPETENSAQIDMSIFS